MTEKIKNLTRKKKIIITILVIVTIIILFVMFYPIGKYMNSSVKENSGIARSPGSLIYNRGKLKEFPKYDEKSNKQWQVDLRSIDLTSFDLSNRLKDLKYADFDSKTKWPNSLPKEFNPKTIMEYGKNPGLNIRKLHQKGITGKGVSIAIIDQALLTKHEEYKDRLKFYEEIHCSNEGENGSSSMHGPAVSSIAVGKNVGVAPEADLYYIGETHGTFTLFNVLARSGFKWDFTYLAKSIDRILEINKTLPKEKKIRVISISVGWNPKQKGFKEVDEAVKRAKKEGILVLSTCSERYYNFHIWGLGREPLLNGDSFSSYKPGLFWENFFYNEYNRFEKNIKNTVMVPMDSRCTASPTGTSDYVFYRSGGLSWSVPYIAGLYALSCQVKPDITPEMFFKEVINTGEVIEVDKEGKKYKLGTIVNPEKLIEKFKIK